MTLSPAQIAELTGLCGNSPADRIARLVADAPDAKLNRINPLAFGAETGIPEDASIAAFLHATRLGIFDLSWNVVCPSCSGVLNENASLKAVDRHGYACTFCAISCEPNLDDVIEVTFTASPQTRAIAAHAPETLTIEDYLRQAYWSSGISLPADLGAAVKAASLHAEELPPDTRVERDLVLPEGTFVLFDPVNHSSQYIKVAGAATTDRQPLAFVLDRENPAREPVTLRPGTVALTFDNRTGRRALPILWIAGEALMTLVGQRIPYLSAKRLLTHQTFRDLYRADTLDVGQRFTITNLTFMFTDLKGSTELYERVGDLVAYDLVREHFQALAAIVVEESGAIVKTIGDAVMATFPSPEQGVTAALRMRDAMSALNRRRGSDDLILKIGLHEGPCLAVTLNDQQDYFGQTVNIAARIQNLADADTIMIAASVGDREAIRSLIGTNGRTMTQRRASLKGIRQDMTVYQIA